MSDVARSGAFSSGRRTSTVTNEAPSSSSSAPINVHHVLGGYAIHPDEDDEKKEERATNQEEGELEASGFEGEDDDVWADGATGGGGDEGSREADDDGSDPPRKKLRTVDGTPQPTGGKYGSEKRQVRREKENAWVMAGRIQSGKLGSDYILNGHGEPTSLRSGESTVHFYNQARIEQQNGINQPIAFDTLQQRGRAVIGLSSAFNRDRQTGVKATLSDGSAVGGLTKSNAPWFKIPANADSHPGEPSAFASALDGNAKKADTTYRKNKGVFSSTSYASETEQANAQRTLVSSAESVRGPGAGLAQTLADQLGRGHLSRDAMYGTKKGPGYLPGGYAGSQADIVLTDDYARQNRPEQVLRNPTGLQTEHVLSDAREQRQRGKLKRRLSEPHLTADDDAIAEDTDAVMKSLGLGTDPGLTSWRPPLARGQSWNG